MTVETKKIGQQYLTLASKLIEYAKKNTKSIRSLLFHYTWRSFYLFIGIDEFNTLIRLRVNFFWELKHYVVFFPDIP